jgi:hypothetical protein
VHQALAPARLRAQRLVGEPLPDPVAVVRHLGAVQAQEHTTVPWSVGRRCAAASIEQVLGPLDDGGVVRTHALRTTWHLLHVDDLPWVVAATGDRVMAQVVPHVRRQGLDEATLLAAFEVAAQAVREAPGCTREDVARRLDDAGLALKGDLLAHAVMAAELRAEVAGRRDPGGPHRYRPLPAAAVVPGVDDARARLAATYVRGHGPATAADLAWWSSLTLAQARRALADSGLEEVERHGRTLWSDPAAEPDPDVVVPPVLLLAEFDELVSHVRDAEVRAEAGAAYDVAMTSQGLVVLDGRVAGGWRRRARSTLLELEVALGVAVPRRTRAALQREAVALARFHGLDDVLLDVR